MFKICMLILAFIAVAYWSYIFGTLRPQVTYEETLPQLYSDYHTFRLEEDGSYTATTTAGMKVTGCIETAICNKQ